MTTTETVLDAPEAAPAALICPNCGASFAPGGRGMGKVFCSTACREAQNARNKARGAVLAPLVLAWLETRHAERGSEAALICSDARRELTEIGRVFLKEDKAAGRPAAASYAAVIMRPYCGAEDAARPYAARSPAKWEDRRRS